MVSCHAAPPKTPDNVHLEATPNQIAAIKVFEGNSACVPAQIFQQAKSQPDAVALSFGDINLTYSALEQRVSQLAEHLRRQGPLSGNTVAICIERSIDWIVAALAVMRTGAAYVPLDPTWPEARMRYAIDESEAVALIARVSTLDRLQSPLPGIDPRRDAATIAAFLSTARIDAQSDALAYVIYTSGSTGVPKGVEITHANLANLVAWHRTAFGVSSNDRASHLAGLGFDAAGWEIWPTLCAGATVCIPTDAVLSSPQMVRSWMLQQSITIGFVPSVYCAAMMEMDWPASTALRFLLTGGDVLNRGPLKQLPFSVVNNYGPTECTVVATFSILETGSAETPSIGRPISGTTVYLLDENKTPVPNGTVGEIYIGGDKVGRGYRNLPEMTEERFVADPFVTPPGGRLYRTGDRGCMRPDGQIQFLGRLDRQVKIRGKRLELDEVGSVLSRHQSLSFATVVAAHDPANEDKYLLAYVVFKPGAEVTKDGLMRHVARHLPEFMIPTTFIQLTQVPLSPNGKLDFAALPQASKENLLQSDAREKTATSTEQQVLGILQDLLDGKQIGVDDNVFLAGGDSLLGMKLIIELKDKFQADVTFDQIFEAPTVKDLAQLIETLHKSQKHQRLSDNHSSAHNASGETSNETPEKDAGNIDKDPQQAFRLPSGVLSLNKTMPSEPIFWVHYLNVNLDRALGQDRHVTFLILTPDDITALGETPSLHKIATQFVQKILLTQPHGPFTIGGFCIGAVLGYEIAVQLRKAGHVVSLLIMLDAPGPSYLKMRGPLGPRLSNPLYIAKRMMKLGLRASWLRLTERLAERFRQIGLGETKAEIHRGQRLIEGAAATYQGETYAGRSLLMLARDNAPHINFLPEWQALIPNDLHSVYIPAHHSELMIQPFVEQIADTITTHLELAKQALPLPISAADDLELAINGNQALESPKGCAPAPSLSSNAQKDPSLACDARSQGK